MRIAYCHPPLRCLIGFTPRAGNAPSRSVFLVMGGVGECVVGVGVIHVVGFEQRVAAQVFDCVMVSTGPDICFGGAGRSLSPP